MTDTTAQPLEELELVMETPQHLATPTLAIETVGRRVRVRFNGVVVADSSRARLVLEMRRLPVYYFPVADVRMDLLTATEHTRPDPNKGVASLFDVTVGDRTADGAAWMFPDPDPGAAELDGLVAFYWHTMDSWFEEDEEVYTHPRDPYHRVDVLRSSRHVRVVVLGETVAESTRPSLLFETHLPTRFYLPRQDVREELIVPSQTTSQCPYKGIATYWSVRVGDTIAQDLAWAYRFPVPECPKIEGLVCFFNEQVDAIFVDDVELPKPQTPWTRPPTLIKVT